MAKFATATVAGPIGPARTTTPHTTHEGGRGFAKDSKTELFTLAVTNMVGESTFYEAAGERDNRYRDLIHQVAAEDPAWVAGFVPWLRNEANMRSAALVAAIEYAAARPVKGDPGTWPRQVVASALARADEPAEALGYWLSHYGRQIPKPVRRGIADAASALYNQHSALKWDNARSGVRMGDVLELTHPEKNYETQGALYEYLLARRHGNLGTAIEGRMFDGLDFERTLPMLATAARLEQTPPKERRDLLRSQPALLKDAGFTWERLSGWLPGGMDAEAWEAVIPSMGYMALIRNLRNFEQAKVSRTVLSQAAGRIADPEEVVKSRQFPYRFWSAYRNSGSIVFGSALESAAELAMRNVPVFSGRTLVAIDTSGSMMSTVSDRSIVTLSEIGALFAATLAARNDVELMIYADRGRVVEVYPSILRTCELIQQLNGAVGHGTQTWPSVLSCYRGHDRIIVFTDAQDHPARVPHLPQIPIYVWDLRGYQATNLELTRDRYLFSGFNDASFRLINLLEAGQNADWPWQTGAA